MRKEYLLTPGPTWVPDRIFAAMQRPTMHHRTAEFEREFQEAIEGIKWLTGGLETPVLLASSGTGAMEAALLNALAPGDKLLVLNAGVFGKRWVNIAQRLELTPVELKAEPGDSAPLPQIEEELRRHPDVKAFCVQYVETSTTVLHPVPQIAEIVRAYAPDCLFVVDAVSALATLDIPVEKLGIDVLVAGSQKGLMLPPGLALLVLSGRAWRTVEAQKRRSLYFDLPAQRTAHRKNTSAWTPALNLILGLNESLRMLREEGLAQVYARHALLARATREALRALEFKLLADQYPSPGVTGGFPPPGIAADTLRTQMLSSYGVRIAGGQAALEGKIVRIGHMGYVGPFDILTAIAALELSLSKLGRVCLGTGTREVLRVIKEAETDR